MIVNFMNRYVSFTAMTCTCCSNPWHTYLHFEGMDVQFQPFSYVMSAARSFICLNNHTVPSWNISEVATIVLCCENMVHLLYNCVLLFWRYKNQEIALNCGQMLRECFRYEELARIIMYSEDFYLFFGFVEVPTFDISSDAFSTFKVKELKKFCLTEFWI